MSQILEPPIYLAYINLHDEEHNALHIAKPYPVTWKSSQIRLSRG